MSKPEIKLLTDNLVDAAVDAGARYLESSMHDAETVFASRRIHLKGHRKWSFDITLWSERVAMADSIHGMELVGMAASQFCPDGKVH